MNELIKALRRCSYMTVADELNEDYCKPCAYYTEDSADVTCIDRMMIDAADAIEKLMAEIDHKDKVIKDMLTTLTGMKDKLIERICANCDTPPETRLRLCGECPIISPIREAFDEQP